MHIQTHTHTHTNKYTHTYTHAHTCIHTHTHTHTHTKLAIPKHLYNDRTQTHMYSYLPHVSSHHHT